MAYFSSVEFGVSQGLMFKCMPYNFAYMLIFYLYFVFALTLLHVVKWFTSIYQMLITLQKGVLKCYMYVYNIHIFVLKSDKIWICIPHHAVTHTDYELLCPRLLKLKIKLVNVVLV